MNSMDIMLIQEIVFPIFGFILGGGVLFGVYKTLNRHLDRQHQGKLAGGTGSETRALVERLEARVEAMEQADRRIEELEERVDFAERVLAQREEPPALKGGD